MLGSSFQDAIHPGVTTNELVTNTLLRPGIPVNPARGFQQDQVEPRDRGNLRDRKLFAP